MIVTMRRGQGKYIWPAAMMHKWPENDEKSKKPTDQQMTDLQNVPTESLSGLKSHVHATENIRSYSLRRVLATLLAVKVGPSVSLSIWVAVYPALFFDARKAYWIAKCQYI